MTRGRRTTPAEPQPEIAASILNADFGRLDRVVHKLERAGVDRLHLDVMDGHFVDNLTFGPDIVAAFRRLTTLPLDVHLMIDRPARYTSRFIDAGADTITLHAEAPEPDRLQEATLRAIAEAGRGAGLAISPRTDVAVVVPHLPLLDIVLVMTVEPGWGGQGFLAEAAVKIGAARELLRRAGRGGRVHVDGGVNRDTAAIVGGYGVDVCVVGSALFQRGRDTAEEVAAVRARVLEGREAGPPTTVPGSAVGPAAERLAG